MRQWFRVWLLRQRAIRRSLKNTHIHRVLGERIFHSHLWGVDRQSLAGGLALGLFVALTPTIPFQMLLCTFGALMFRVNLPIALAACWVTNPLTAVPIYLAARRLGKALFADTPIFLYSLDLFRLEGRGKRFLEESIFLWTGCLIFAAAGALAGHLGVNLSWRLLGKLVKKPRRALRARKRDD